MPGYLIKTPFFTASIENDEELVQLASVDTVKKDTMIRVLPGKEWIEAAQLPLLRKIWGIDTDVVVPPVALSEHHSIPSINTFSVTNQIKPVDTLAKPGAKLPPRLETTIDINPLFRELYVEPEDALTGLLDEGEHVEASAGDKANAPEAEVSAENAPEAEASAENAPEAEVSAENAPDAEASAENAPEAEAFAENAPEAETSSESAPETETSSENLPEAEASAENAPDAEASAENAPEAEAFAENAPEAEASAENAPEAEASAENAPETELARNIDDGEKKSDDEIAEALGTQADKENGVQRLSISSILAFGFENIQSSVSHTWELFDAGSDAQESAKLELDAFEKQINALDTEAMDKLAAAEEEDIQVISHSMLEAVDRSGDGDAETEAVEDEVAPEDVQDVVAEVDEEADGEASEDDQMIAIDLTAPEDFEEVPPAPPVAEEIPPAPPVAEEIPPAPPVAEEIPPAPPVAEEVPPAPPVANEVDENAETNDLSIVRTASDLKPDEESVLKSLRDMEIRASEEIKTNDMSALDLLDVLAAEELRTHDCNVVKPSARASEKDAENLQDIQDIDSSDIVADSRDEAPRIGKDEYVEAHPEDVTYVIASESVDANVAVRRSGIRNSETLEAVKEAVVADNQEPATHGRKTKNTMPMMAHVEEPKFQELAVPAMDEFIGLSDAVKAAKDDVADALKASNDPIYAVDRQCDENAMTRPILPEDRLPTRSRIRVRKTGHGRYGYPPEDDELSLADEVVESDMTRKFDDDREDLTKPQEPPFGIAAKDGKKSSDDRLFHAESLLSALGRSSDGLEDGEENPSDIFRIRNRSDVKLRLVDHEAELEAEAGEVSASDRLRVRERSELRKLLFSKGKGTEEDTVKEDTDITVKDYANLPEGELRRIFEKSDELHLFLANEIREKESEVERSNDGEALPEEAAKKDAKKPVKADKDLEALTSDMPVVSQAVVVSKTTHTAEPTHLTMKAVSEDLSIQEVFIEENMYDDEEKIASFDTFYLTTRRVWDIEASRGQITNYGSYDLEQINLLRLYNRRKRGLLSIAVVIMLLAVSGWGYVFFNNITKYNINWILLGIAVWALIMIPVFYLVGYRRVLQIGTSNVIVESKHAIPKELSNKALEFLSRVDAARAERRRKLRL